MGSALARRGNFVPKIEGKKEDDLVPPRKKKKLFRDNVQQLLPSNYYRQFKDWFSHMSKEKQDWGKADTLWFDNFNFFSNESHCRITRVQIHFEVEKVEVVVGLVRMAKIIGELHKMHTVMIMIIVGITNPLTTAVLTGRMMSMVIPICG